MLSDQPHYDLRQAVQRPLEHRRTRRDHGLRVDGEKLVSASKQIYGLLSQVKGGKRSGEKLRGLRGGGLPPISAFFDEMILGDKETFFLPGAQPSPSAGRRQRHALLRLQPAGPMTAPPPWRVWGWIPMWDSCTGTARSDFLGPGPDGGTASLHGGPLCAHAHQQPPGQGGDFQYMESGAVLLVRRRQENISETLAGKKKENTDPPPIWRKSSHGG